MGLIYGHNGLKVTNDETLNLSCYTIGGIRKRNIFDLWKESKGDVNASSLWK